MAIGPAIFNELAFGDTATKTLYSFRVSPLYEFVLYLVSVVSGRWFQRRSTDFSKLVGRHLGDICAIKVGYRVGGH